MPRQEGVALEGAVVEALPNATFRVRLDQGHTVLAHIAGRLRLHQIRLVIGDRVLVELSPYDLTRGRIRTRLR